MNLAEVAIPLANETTLMSEITQKTQQKALEVLNADNEALLDVYMQELVDIEGNFQACLGRMEGLVEYLDEHFSIHIQVSAEGQQACFADVKEMVDARRQEIVSLREAQQQLEDFEGQRKQLNEILFNFTRQAETAMNEKEENSRVLILSGDATIQELADMMEEIFNDNYPMVKGATRLTQYLVELQDIARTYLSQEDETELDDLSSVFEKRCRSFQSQQKRLESRARLEELKVTIAELTTAFEELKDMATDDETGCFAIHNRALVAKAYAYQIQTQLEVDQKHCQGAIDTLVLATQNLSDKARQQAHTGVRRTQVNSVMVLMAGIVIGLISALVLIRFITYPIKKAINILKEVAAGNLTQNIESDRQDEMGHLAEHINTMISNLKEMVSEVQTAAQHINTSGQEILVYSASQAQGVSNQSQAVSQTACGAAELSKTSQVIGQNIDKIANVTEKVSCGMERIQASTDQTSRILTTLNEKSRQISHITELIDDVADQTNLLSINASIEAARAGDQGRGFMVVADQISKLADSTAQSTKDIKSLVDLIQHEMGNAIVTMNQSMANIQKEIERSKESASMSKEIAVNASQQVMAAQQISEAMVGIDTMMSDIVEEAHQSSNAASLLSGLANNLNDTIAQFKI